MKKLLSFVGAVALSAAAFATETNTYTSVQTVSAAITGDRAVVVNVPNAYKPAGGDPMGWTGIVEFTAANDFTGDVIILSGAVKVSNLEALGTGRIKMSPHTAIIVAVSYKNAAKTLNDAIIDRIEVQNPDGLVEPDLWAAFIVQGDGITNDIDFSNQPNLWLSAPKSKSGWQNDYQTLNGTLTPYGDTYKFGYNFLNYTETTCLAVDGLCDKADGTPRNVVFRGSSTQTLGKNLSFTGRIRIEDGAGLNFTADTGLGPIPAELRTNQIVISGQNCRLNPRCSATTFNEKIGITVESGASVSLYPQGNTVEAKANTFKGPLCGSGTIIMGDNGGFRFTATNNTFSGDFMLRDNSREQWIIIGDGEHFSWGNGGTFSYYEWMSTAVPQHLVLNSNADADFGMKVTGKGRLIKRGSGTITLTQPLAKTYLAGLPTVSVEGGTLKRGVAETSEMKGWALLSAGATFDLNGLAAANVYLPYGAGSIVNPAENASVVISNPAQTNDVTFAGRIAANVKLTNTASVPWRVGAGATFDGGLDIRGGEVRFEDGVDLATAVSVAKGATLSFAGTGVNVGGLSGEGTLRLAGGAWPTVAGNNDFSGRYLVEGATVGGEASVPGGSALCFAGDLRPSEAWIYNSTYAGHAYPTNFGHRTALVVADGYHPAQYGSAAGGVHSPRKVDVRTPWVLSFSVRTSPAYAYTSIPQYGDGFAMVFQDQGTTATGGNLAKYANDTTELCKIAGSYGIHFWSDGKSFDWVKDKVRNVNAGSRVTGLADFQFENWRTTPLKVRLSYDGEKMVATFTRGTSTRTYTNANAGAELSERFANGAYVSFLSSAGGWCCGLTIEDFAFNHVATVPPSIGGVLALSGGEVELASDGAASMTVSAALKVTGAAELVRNGDVPLAFTGTDWTFDFTGGATPSLKFPAGVTLPEEVSVTVLGTEEELPARWTTLVDLSNYVAAGGVLPAFTVGVDCGADCRTRVKDNALQFRRVTGTVLIFR